MSEMLIALAALAAGVLLGLFLRRPRPRSTPLPGPPRPRSAHRELLNAADDLGYALDTIRNFGPLCASELRNVDLPAKLDRLAAAGAPPDVFAELRGRTEQIALHPFPEQRELVSAVRSDEQPSPLSAVWLLIREASGSGAAQHLAAGQAKTCLDALRLELARNAPEDEPVLV
ncbi:hypothetical protein ACFFQW_20020 [Umezawaea endophytica]|uniref:Uncharacterized protein n=1 Tax=Umezawaea endophytica TaxID=1654476 RepID=A0A9X2VTJ7_9PSEU|nr:hypothetical protein [Umezawaea endophytica]MCS7482396.1 hypothetical protein [Umezawaea endophytica]